MKSLLMHDELKSDAYKIFKLTMYLNCYQTEKQVWKRFVVSKIPELLLKDSLLIEWHDLRIININLDSVLVSPNLALWW